MAINYNPTVATNGLALCLDAANPKSFSPNVFPKPTDIFGWVGTTVGNACTLSRDTISSPVGNTPIKMVVTANDPNTPTFNVPYWNISAVSNTQTWVVSVYAKASVATTSEIFIFGADSTGVSFVGGSWIGIAAKTINLTTEWTRQDHFITFNNAAVAYIHLRLDGPNASGAGQTIWWDGLQVELASSPSTFNPKTNVNRLSWVDLVTQSNTTLVNSPTYNTDSLSLSYLKSQSVSVAGSGYNFLNTVPYTLEAWVYPTRNPGASNWTGIFDRESNIGAGRDGYNVYFVGSAGTSTSFTTERWCSGVASIIAPSIDQSISVNNWSHIVVTFNFPVLSLYRNGVLISSTVSAGSITNSTKTLDIGVRGGQYFDGKISNAKVYIKALTTGEVQANFNAMRGRYNI